MTMKPPLHRCCVCTRRVRLGVCKMNRRFHCRDCHRRANWSKLPWMPVTAEVRKEKP